MADYGMLVTGFNPKPGDQILADIESTEQALIGSSLNLQPTALIGVLNGIVMDAASANWQILQPTYNGIDPTNASGDQLVSTSLLTGTEQLKATPTYVSGCNLVLTSLFAGAAPNTMFANCTGNTAIQYSNVTAVAAGAGTPTVDFKATTTGPNNATPSTLTQIAQPLTGWVSITNPTDGIVGKNIESDPDLRLRRAQELSQSGTSTAASISGAVLSQLPNTLSCTVLHNDTDSTDANGLLPHSIEVIAYLPGNTGDDDQALVNLIGQQKAAGINTNGTSSGTFVDSQGISETINFTRPTAVPIYVTLTALTNPNTRSATPVIDIEKALVDYSQSGFLPGVEVYGFHLLSQAFAPDVLTGAPPVAGLLTVVTYNVGTAPSPSTINVPIGFRQVATLSGTNIAVTVTP